MKQFTCTLNGRARETHRKIRRQTLSLPRFRKTFNKVKHISGPGPRKTRHRINQILMIDPFDTPHTFEEAICHKFLAFRDFGTRNSSRNTTPH